jgi:hydrogenase maturation protein HypF
MGLQGTVRNVRGRVEIHVQGAAAALEGFVASIVARAPPLARPQLQTVEVAAFDVALAGFRIVASEDSGEPQVFVPPDYFACDECLAEMADPANRRYRYPFINCTQCGPRYTLIRAMPYDRVNTSMAAFPLCAACSREYADPADRRYHAEPIACPACGPRIALLPAERAGADARAAEPVSGEDALRGVVQHLQRGDIVAVRGIGGYHLMCDARNARAIARLRERKHRPHKPLAVMFPRRGEDGLDAVREHAEVDALAARGLLDPARPIILLPLRADGGLAPAIAPDLDEVGAFLPYSPLHEMILGDFGGPLVATSGNLSGEPVITDPQMAQRRLAPIADAFLHHDRPIVRPADDTVVRRVRGRLRPLRLGRGAAPLELELAHPLPAPLLATGAHLKNCVALGWGRRVVLSPHIGTLEHPRSLEVFAQVIEDLQGLYGVRAQGVVCDAHPGYASSRWARNCGLPLQRVWHHEAHASALAAEAARAGNLLVFCWDGVGLGADGSLWGGEAFAGRAGRWRRVASLRRFRLPGGDRAAREPWRSAASLCWHAGIDVPAASKDLALLHAAWQRGINAPWTSSVGRLFDAAACVLTGLRETSYEAQGPMRLEAFADNSSEFVELSWSADDAGLPRLDWGPLLPLLGDASVPAPRRAALLHQSLAAAVAGLATQLHPEHRFEAVGLTGGVFQNRLLSAATTSRLELAGFEAILPERLPANDAAIAFGQLAEIGALKC